MSNSRLGFILRQSLWLPPAPLAQKKPLIKGPSSPNPKQRQITQGKTNQTPCRKCLSLSCAQSAICLPQGDENSHPSAPVPPINLSRCRPTSIPLPFHPSISRCRPTSIRVRRASSKSNQGAWNPVSHHKQHEVSSVRERHVGPFVLCRLLPATEPPPPPHIRRCDRNRRSSGKKVTSVGMA